MCFNGPRPSNTKTERECLEEALNRPSVLGHSWCPDGRIIIDAARKHLATLPKPLQWCVRSDGLRVGGYTDLREAQRKAANEVLEGARSVSIDPVA